MLNGIISKDEVDPTMADISLDTAEVLGSLRIGGGIPYGGILYSSPFSGRITDLNIWSRALAREEMEALQGECRYPARGPDLVAWATAQWDIVGNITMEEMDKAEYCQQATEDKLFIMKKASSFQQGFDTCINLGKCTLIMGFNGAR